MTIQAVYHRRLVGIAVLASAAAAFLAISAEASPSTTVVVTPDPIKDLIVADRKAAWCSQIGDGDDSSATAEIWVQDLGSGARVKFDSFQGGDSAAWDIALMAFDGDRAVWMADLYGPGGSESWFYTDALSDRRHTSLGEFYDEFLWKVEPDGTPLLYGRGRGLRLVTGRTDRRVPRIQNVRMASATKSRIVVVRADTGAVELRRFPNGKLVRTIPVDGAVRALALTPHLVTLLVKKDGKLRLVRFRLSGKRLGSTAVPNRTPSRLDANGKWVVFSARNRIFALNGETGKVTRLRTLDFRPGDLQASGGRVYWYANWGGRGHVATLPLPSG